MRNTATHHQEHRGGASKERGSEEGEKRGKRWGSCAGNSAYRIANPTAQKFVYCTDLSGRNSPFEEVM
jgi:hypothetical protein